MPDTFTPEQISQILEEFFKVVGTRQYIGARYVPIFGRKDETSIEWDNTAPYEPLTIVLYHGNSYTSRQFVPVGVEITNQEFWAITGNYNAQVEQYRRETAAAREAADAAQESADAAQNDIDTLLPKSDFSAENTVKKYVDDSVATVQSDIDTLLPKSDFSAENTVKKYVDDSVETVIERLSGKLSIVDTYSDLLDTTEDTVCVKQNYSPLGDSGVCFFIKTDYERGSIERNDGSYVIPIPNQDSISTSAAPMNDIISCAASYIGKSNLVYGNDNTLFSDTCTNQIDCSSFVMAVLQGISYKFSRYARGTNSDNIIGAYVGDYPKYNYAAPARMLTWTMAQYYMEHKQFTKFSGNWQTDITLLQAGDILFSTTRSYADQKRLYDIDHCMLVLKTFPNDGTIMIMQCGSAIGTMTNMQNTTGKISIVGFANYDTPDDVTRSSYIGFARPAYGNGEMQSNASIMETFHTLGRKQYTDGTTSIPLGTILLSEPLQPNVPYTLQVKGRLPKYDVDGCWLAGSIAGINIARWYHISLYENYAEITFVPSDDYTSKSHALDVRVISDAATEYASYFEITNIDIYKGYSRKTELPYVLQLTLNDTDNFTALETFSWGGLIMPNGEIKINALLSTISQAHSGAGDYPAIAFEVPENYKPYTGMYNKNIYIQGSFIGGIAALIANANATNGAILQLTGELPNNMSRTIYINHKFHNVQTKAN